MSDFVWNFLVLIRSSFGSRFAGFNLQTTVAALISKLCLAWGNQGLLALSTDRGPAEFLIRFLRNSYHLDYHYYLFRHSMPKYKNLLGKSQWMKDTFLANNQQTLFSLPDVKSCTCYTFHSSVKSWTNGREICENYGGDLVSMETREEWEMIRDEIQNRETSRDPKNEWHIGLMKLNDTWTWVSGKRLQNTAKGKWPWQEHQPTGGPDDAAVIAKDFPKGTRGLFNDLSKWQQRGFICEIVAGWQCSRWPNHNMIITNIIMSSYRMRTKFEFVFRCMPELRSRGVP